MREFDRLTLYAKADIAILADKKEAFLNCLFPLLQSKLAVIDFCDFRHLVDILVIYESKEKALEDSLKCKAASSSHNQNHSFRVHPMQRQQQYLPHP